MSSAITTNDKETKFIEEIRALQLEVSFLKGEVVRITTERDHYESAWQEAMLEDDY